MATTDFNVHDPIVHTGYYDKNSASTLSNAVESLFVDLPTGKAFNVIMKYSGTQYYCSGIKLSAAYGNVLSQSHYGTYPLRYSTLVEGTWTHKVVSLQNV